MSFDLSEGVIAAPVTPFNNDESIDWSTGRYDPQLLVSIGSSGEVGGRTELESLGDRGFTDVDVDRSGIRRSVNHAQTAVSRLANAERLATRRSDRSDQRQELDIAGSDLAKRKEIVDLSSVYLDPRGGEKGLPRVRVADFQFVCAGVDVLIVGRVRKLDAVDHRFFVSRDADANRWGVWYGVDDPPPRLPSLGLSDVDRIRLELDVGHLPDDGKDIGCPAIKCRRLVDDRRTTIRRHDLDLMITRRQRGILRRTTEGNALHERLPIDKNIDGRCIRRGMNDADGRVRHTRYRRRLLPGKRYQRRRHQCGDQCHDEEHSCATGAQQTWYGVPGKPLHESILSGKKKCSAAAVAFALRTPRTTRAFHAILAGWEGTYPLPGGRAGANNPRE